MQFLLMSLKKSMAVIVTCVYASVSSCLTFLENGIGYYAMT